MRRRTLAAGLSASASLALMPGAIRAAEPARPDRIVTILLGAREGSTADKAARGFSGFLARHLTGIEISWHNMPGDAGHTMLAALSSAAPDGTTIGWVVTPTLPARIIDREDPFLLERIQLIGQVEKEPVAFVSPPDEQLNSVQDIIQRASDDADAVPLGTPPAGSPPHLAVLRLQVLAQTQLNIVTFPSSAAARQAVLAGNVSAAALALSETIGDIREGNLTAVGITARRRFGLLPDAPVLDEGGIPLSAFIRRGFAIPAGTPSELITPFINALRSSAEDDDFRVHAEAAGYHAAWEDGPLWLNQMQEDRSTLAKLWEINPWLSSSAG